MNTFALLNDEQFLQDKFNYLQKVSYDNDIDFNPSNHINNTLVNNKNIDFDKINQYLINNNVQLHMQTIKDFFHIYLQHNNINTLSKNEMLANFLKMVKFYNQFSKRNTPVYNNNKQTKRINLEEKGSEIDNSLTQYNGVSKAMNFHNKQYLTKKI